MPRHALRFRPPAFLPTSPYDPLALRSFLCGRAQERQRFRLGLRPGQIHAHRIDAHLHEMRVRIHESGHDYPSTEIVPVATPRSLTLHFPITPDRDCPSILNGYCAYRSDLAAKCHDLAVEEDRVRASDFHTKPLEG